VWNQVNIIKANKYPKTSTRLLTGYFSQAEKWLARINVFATILS
jgi:hypothetical protein